MTEKPIDYPKFSWLNKWQINDFKDYSTILKEGFLFNLDFNKIKIEWFSKSKLIEHLNQKLHIKNDNKETNSKLKEIIYSILKKVIKYDFNKNNIPLEEAIKEILETSFKELNLDVYVDLRLINIFTTIYKKSSFLTRLDLITVTWIK